MAAWLFDCLFKGDEIRRETIVSAKTYPKAVAILLSNRVTNFTEGILLANGLSAVQKCRECHCFKRGKCLTHDLKSICSTFSYYIIDRGAADH